ncbi:MAG: glycosyltransferase [Candidatus Omnitrophica bacterium]|nr:glycosyltransferase [Candidatus Omnitrophota bacterium]
MKIMQILPKMNIGGIERGVIDLALFFKRKGIIHSEEKIENIVVSGGGRLVHQLESAGIKHYKLDVYKKSLTSLLLIPKLRKIIKEEKIDIVHARSRVPGWLSFFACRNTNAHFITTAHGVYKNKIFSSVMGWGKYVICPSKVVARHMKNNFRVPDEKIIVINRWVDLNKFKFTDYSERKESNNIVSIGRLSASKGYEHLIKAFKKIVRYNPYMKLKIIGSADKSKLKYFNYLKMLVRRYSLNYNVEFIGFKEDVESVLENARILVAPSVIEESFGRVVVEAFACGVPVVATKVGGYEEIIEDGKNGRLVEPGNSEEITESILKLLKNDNFAKELTIEGRKKVETMYTLDKCLGETKDVYKLTLDTLKILVIKLSSLGDIILAIPALKELKNHFPQAHISLLTLKKYHSIIFDCPYIDDIITVEDNYKKIKNMFNISKNFRSKSFDYVIDLQNNRASHIISFLSLPRCSFGYNLRWGNLLVNKIKYNPIDGPLDSQEKVLNLLGIKFKEKKLLFWERKGGIPLSLPDAELIGINISASKKWHSKNWPYKNIVKLIDLIYKNFPAYKVILLGDKDSIANGDIIEKSFSTNVYNLCGKTTLRELPQVIKELTVFITPDTATLHLSCALNISTIALFGPTDPSRHTVACENLYILCKKLACSFCYKSKCKLEEDSPCLVNISPQQVLNKIKEIVL